MGDEEFEAQATAALTTCAWSEIAFERHRGDPAAVEAKRAVNGHVSRISVRGCGPNSETWLASIKAKDSWIGSGRASTALEAVLAAQRDAVHTLGELAHLCGASFGKAP